MSERRLEISPGDLTTFTHDKTLFLFRVWGEGVFSLGVAVYSLFQFFPRQEGNPLWLIPFGVASYTFYRLLIRGGAPSQIVLRHDAIELQGPGGTRVHPFSDIEAFQVRQFSASKTLYLRIRRYSGRGQKCWIEWKVYSYSDELLNGLLQIERMVHPDSLKEWIRINNERHDRFQRR